MLSTSTTIIVLGFTDKDIACLLSYLSNEIVRLKFGRRNRKSVRIDNNSRILVEESRFRIQ